MIVLVCGGRKYAGDVSCLDMLENVELIIHGGATGADIRAGQYMASKGVHQCIVPALWDFYDRPAGTIRNTAMLLLKPDYCVAFPGGSGTRNMVKQCEDLGIPVWRPYGL